MAANGRAPACAYAAKKPVGGWRCRWKTTGRAFPPRSAARWGRAARSCGNDVSMVPQDKSGLSKAFLGGLPGSAAARLAMAVEVDRLMDGHTLPHDDIMEGLRPVLRRENYERTPTPLRLFCRPFQ